jgi:hypothetical protein
VPNGRAASDRQVGTIAKRCVFFRAQTVWGIEKNPVLFAPSPPSKGRGFRSCDAYSLGYQRPLTKIFSQEIGKFCQHAKSG